MVSSNQSSPRDRVELAGGDELTVGVDHGDVTRRLILLKKVEQGGWEQK